MAPFKRSDHTQENLLSEELFAMVRYQAKVPSVFVSVKEAEKKYGVLLKVCNILTE